METKCGDPRSDRRPTPTLPLSLQIFLLFQLSLSTDNADDRMGTTILIRCRHRMMQLACHRPKNKNQKGTVPWIGHGDTQKGSTEVHSPFGD